MMTSLEIGPEIGPAVEGIMERRGRRTWFGVVGEMAGDRAPVIVCHGGPGMTHDYLLPVADLVGRGHACVFYDQFGNGRSGHRPDAPADFWTVELFVDELAALIEHVSPPDGYHLLGHSWGGMLALELAARRPEGLRSIVVADAFASSADYLDGVAGLVAGLPADVRSTIEEHEAAGTTESPEYQRAVRAFYGRHVCRARPVPDEVMRTMAALAGDPTVYTTMAGPSEFHMTGPLKDWTIADRLHLVDVPVLLISGRYDEVTPGAVEPLRRGLPDARWELFEESSHMPHIEERDRFTDLVAAFLR
ncbi:proline iminopeptidase-family hydrolase [Actinomadura sp. 9N407]|uniref:proline iminopeptidase-family hydrolase n=1 Tax=Actinomadura sp. 9N407 TaxID=3375154 RepID=UPI00378B59F7